MQNKNIAFERLIRRVCQQKLLPTIINSMSNNQIQNNSFVLFKKAIHNKYKQTLRVPQIYIPGQQKTDRQKLIEKIQKIKRNQLPIQYIEMKKDSQGKFFPTYRGHRLEEIQIPTKDQFKIFKDLNQQNFQKNILDSIFDDKLQFSEKQLIKNPYTYNSKNERKKRLNTVNQYPKKKQLKQRLFTQKQEAFQQQKKYPKLRQLNTQVSKFPTIITSCRNQKSTARKRNYVNLQKLSMRKVISGDELNEIKIIFNRIGGYQNTKNNGNLVTKQSILKYIKKFYEKPNRIIDFLQIKQVVSFQQYVQIAKKIKIMQRQHFNFMTFLFYDTNNDGFICEGDIARLQGICKIYPILNEDYKKLIMSKFEQKKVKIPDYFELYGLTQITQTNYFNWKKSNKKQQIGQQQIQSNDQSIQLDTKLLNIKRKKYSIDFYRFSQIFKNCKPMFWFQLMNRLNGTRYQGINYQN